VITEQETLWIYVDGSSRQGPRRGGIGVLFAWINAQGEEECLDVSPGIGFAGATNNRMELEAVVFALGELASRHPVIDVERYRKVIIRSDSLYVCENYQAALFRWPADGWMTRDGNPVANPDLWKEFRALVVKLDKERHVRVDVTWIKGKSDELTKLVDKAAKRSSEGPLQGRSEIQRVRRRKSAEPTAPGAIPMRGQVSVIRVIAEKRLGVQRVDSLKVELWNRESKRFDTADNVWSRKFLRAGHTYLVRFSQDDRRREIEQVFGEVTFLDDTDDA